MNLVIRTSEDMYRAFLRGIRKEHTSVIRPVYFNPFINEEVIKWVKSKLPLVEFNQKRIDDLEMLRVVTDGTSMAGSYTPIVEEEDGYFGIPTQFSEIVSGFMMSNGYPLYLHGLNVSFKRRDDSEWLPARIRKSDKTVMMASNPYRKPSTSRIYFELIKGEIRRIGGNEEDQLRLEYIRYPKLIQYSTVLADNLDPEFSPAQNQEIVDQAVRSYLERIMDPRYKSFLQEMMIQSQGN